MSETTGHETMEAGADERLPAERLLAWADDDNNPLYDYDIVPDAIIADAIAVAKENIDLRAKPSAALPEAEPVAFLAVAADGDGKLLEFTLKALTFQAHGWRSEGEYTVQPLYAQPAPNTSKDVRALADKATALERSLEADGDNVNAYLRDDIESAISAMRSAALSPHVEHGEAVGTAEQPVSLRVGEKVYSLDFDSYTTLSAHGIIYKDADGYRLGTEEELAGDPGSAGVNHPSPGAVIGIVRAALNALFTHSEGQ